MRTLPDTTDNMGVDVNTAASGGDCVITRAAISDEYHVINWVVWSYDADPTSGSLIIQDTTNNTELLNTYITVGGTGGLFFGNNEIHGGLGAAVTATLADGTAEKTLNIHFK